MSARGMASGHLEKRSIMVRQYLNPLQGGNDWSDQIYADVLKTPIRRYEVGRHGLNVPGDLKLLASEAISSPCSNIAMHVRPDISLPDCSVTDLSTRVRW